MMNKNPFELNDEMLDSIAGGMNTDVGQDQPTAQAIARGMTLHMSYQVKKAWANCECGCDTYKIVRFFSDDSGFEVECTACSALGGVSYGFYDMVI